jgi:hypothetical protein
MTDGSSASLVVTLLWAVLAAATALSLTLGAILAYHWIRFSMSPFVPMTAMIAYAGGAVFFLFVMLVALVTY